MQSVEDFKEALEEAKLQILPEYGITDVRFLEERGNGFAISFTVANPPWPSFRPGDGYSFTKKDPPWTPDEIFRAIAEFTIRVRS